MFDHIALALIEMVRVGVAFHEKTIDDDSPIEKMGESEARVGCVLDLLS